MVNFEQLATNLRDPAVDVILLDTTFWGGIRPCIKAAGVCETFQTGIAVHSSGELGIQLATMLHLGAVLPNLTFAGDAHYHHLADDVIAGGKLAYRDGAIAVPDAPGLGVRLDRDRVERWAEHYRRGRRLPLRSRPAATRAGSPWSRTRAGPTHSTTGCRPCWHSGQRQRQIKGKRWTTRRRSAGC